MGALLYLQVLYLQQAEVTRERVYGMHQSSIDGVEDMSALAELHEAAIMHNLYQRYQKDNIYVSVFTQKCVADRTPHSSELHFQDAIFQLFFFSYISAMELHYPLWMWVFVLYMSLEKICLYLDSGYWDLIIAIEAWSWFTVLWKSVPERLSGNRPITASLGVT